MTALTPHAATPPCPETFEDKKDEKGEGRRKRKGGGRGKGGCMRWEEEKGMGLWMEVCFMRGRV
jgi:hypothetical protein